MCGTEREEEGEKEKEGMRWRFRYYKGRERVAKERKKWFRSE